MARPRVIAQKGLGAKMGLDDEFKVGGTYRRYAALIIEDFEYNILIRDDPMFKDVYSSSYIEEGTFIFPEMVSKMKAKRKYRELK